MGTDYSKVLRECKLFNGVGDDFIELTLKLSDKQELEKKQILSEGRGIYIVASGKLGIYHSENGKNVLFNTLGTSEAFGYAGLFSDSGESACTQIKAEKNTKLLFIQEERVKELITAEPIISLAIIKELTGKIRFLNKKLDSFTSCDLKHRLMKYFASLRYDESGRARLPVSMSALAGRLGVGRASLYRLMAELTREGVIERQGNEIILKKRLIDADFDKNDK